MFQQGYYSAQPQLYYRGPQVNSAYNYTSPAIAYNNNAFVQNPQQRKSKKDQVKKYYNDNQKRQTAIPLTITWRVNAYVEEKKDNIIKRCCTRIRNRNKVDDVSQTPVAYQTPYGIQYAPQVVTNDEPKVKHILKDVNGIVTPGKLCAIMGASGSGKTTLLNVLNFRNRGKLIIEGDIKVNGKQISWKDLSKYSGYVQQEDLYIGTLKVKEHLRFLAVLKMDRHLSNSEKYDRVEEVMMEMNLKHIENTYIGQGDRLKGISGGEQRRLAFASEVLTNPQLLFCDEPTTGLDSFMAQSIVDSMALLAKQGKTIISTIHQPSSQVFEKFDLLCLLAEGRVAFMGSTKDAITFFQSIGHPSPPLYNPADHYINVLSVRASAREQGLQNVNRICDQFKSSQYNQYNMQATAAADRIALNADKEEKTKVYNASRLTQTYWLFWRSMLNSIREPISTKVLFMQSIVIGVFFGLTYLQTDKNEKGVQNLNGLLFIVLMQVSFGYIFPIINSFPFELAVFYRETKNRVYGVTPYYCSKLLSEMPKYVFFVFIMITIIYWMSDVLNNGKVYIVIVLLYILASQIAMGFGLLLSILTPNVEAATGLAPAMILPLIIYGGFFLNNDSSPDYFIWIKYISWFYYSFEAILIELWTNVSHIDCTIPLSDGKCASTKCFKSGLDVLDKLNVKVSNFDRDIGLLIALFVVPRVLGLIILKIKSKFL